MAKNHLDESALTDAMRAGSETAFRQLFEHYYPDLVRGLRRFVPDDDTSKDLVQEVFVELWNKREQLDIHSNLGAYLRRAAVNRALNYLKQQERIQSEDTNDMADVADTHDQTLAEHDAFEIREQALFEAIETLPDKCRQVFALSRFENLSHKQIADQLGISTKTIENQITKAMKLLREALLKSGGMSPVVISMLIWMLGT